MLNQRQLQILKLIIDDFIDTGEPIGSRTIAKKSPLGISSATIRNEMADLEDLGFLYQPYSSAGRIPSEQGFRFYVDALVSDSILEQDKKQKVRSLLISKQISPEEIVKEAATMLSSMSKMIAIITLPTFKKSRLKNMKLVRITENKVLLILVSDKGIVKSRELEFPSIDQRILDILSDSLLNRLYNFTIEDINVKNISKIKFELKQYEDIIEYLLPILKSTLEGIDDLEFYVDGINNVIGLKEFSDVNKLKDFLEILEDKDKMAKILIEDELDGISVKIGSENKLEQFKECSLIRGNYGFKDNDKGVIAIIGSTRLDYGKAISYVDYFRNTLTDIFNGIVL
jgi:heat-inducible transcriptional repressor